MREVQQVSHGDEGVVQSLHGRDPLVRIQRQHLLQQVYELPPVGLLCQDVCALQVCHVYLQEDRKSVFVELRQAKGQCLSVPELNFKRTAPAAPSSPASCHPDS